MKYNIRHENFYNNCYFKFNDRNNQHIDVDLCDKT